MLYSVCFSTRFIQIYAHGQSDFIARDTDQRDQLRWVLFVQFVQAETVVATIK